MTIEQIEGFGLTINEELLQRLGIESVDELIDCSTPGLVRKLEEIDELKSYFDQITRYYNAHVTDFENALTMAKAIIKVATNDDGRKSSEKVYVDYIEERVKTLDSLKAKCWKKGLMPKEVPTSIYDIAGLRIIVDYKDKIDRISEILHHTDGLSWPFIEDEDGNKKEKRTKNYIDNPKENGYRGLHLTPEVLVPDKHIHVPVEIQIRTNGQHLWAKMEHKLNFKPIFSGSISEDEQKWFKEAAEKMLEFDERITSIRIAREPDKVIPPPNQNNNPQ